MNPKELAAEIRSLEIQAEGLNARLQKTRQAFAEATCPFKPGDETTVVGAFFKGRRCVIERIGPSCGLGWRVFARVIDGTQLKIVDWQKEVKL